MKNMSEKRTKKSENVDSNSKVNKKKISNEKLANTIEKSSKYAKAGLEVAKEKAIIARDGLAKTAEIVVDKSVKAQKAVLTYVDTKKNAKFLNAKLSSFKDGLIEGKTQTVDYIKKHANFCLAATAISFFFARSDGNISEEELLEIQFDLDSIIKNRDLPDELRNKLAEISLNENLEWSEVKTYLDGVGIETLHEFEKDIEEIIIADGKLTEQEIKAKSLFDNYLKKRLENK